MLVDQKTERVVVPLNASLGAEGRLELANSAYTLVYIEVLSLTSLF